MNNEKKSSIWNRELSLPVDIKLPQWVDALACTLAGLCLLVCVLHPIPVAVLTWKHGTIDYPWINYLRLAREWLYPMVRYVGGASLVLCALNHWSSVKKQWRRHPTYVLFVLLSAWILLVTEIHGWDYWAQFGTETMGESVWVEVGCFVLLFPMCALLSDSKWKVAALRLFAATSAFLAVMAFVLWQMRITSEYIIGWDFPFSCIHINTNYYGYYLTVAVALCVAMVCAEKTPFWKGFAAFCLVLNTAAMSYNSTMGAWVGSFFACLFLIVALRIRDGKFSFWAWVAFGIYLLIMTVTGLTNGFAAGNSGQLFNDLVNLTADSGSEASMHAGSGRWIIWVRCMSLIQAHPWFGLGFECVVAKGFSGFLMECNRPHNEFMEYALFYGIPAAVLYFAGCLSVYLRALRYKAQLDDMTLAALTAAFGYLVGSFFGLRVYNTAPYLFIMLGLGYLRTREE